MNFKEYQEESRKLAIYPNKDKNFVYPTLGLVGEAGEVAEKVKKIIRDSKELTPEVLGEIEKELGDVLWYLSNLSTELGLEFENVALKNLEKLNSRKERGTLHGSGDNR